MSAREDGGSIELLQMITQDEVLQRIPISRKSLDRMENRGRFPRGRYVTPNRKAYILAEVVKWQAAVDEYDPHRGRGRHKPKTKADAPAAAAAEEC